MTRKDAELVLERPEEARRLAQKVLARSQEAKAARRRSRALPRHPAAKQANERKAATKRTAKEERQRIRAAVVARAEGRCEAVVVAPGPVRRCSGFAAEWDHFWGRAREEGVESTWMLCAKCHFEKTRNHPDRRLWLISFSLHTDQYGYHRQHRKAQDALALEAAQHPEVKP